MNAIERDALEGPESGANRNGHGRFQPGHRLGGRPAGSRTRTGEQLREMIFEALDELGGADYLAQLGREQPKSFATLLARLLPKDDKQEENHLEILARRLFELQRDAYSPALEGGAGI